MTVNSTPTELNSTRTSQTCLPNIIISEQKKTSESGKPKSMIAIQGKESSTLFLEPTTAI